MGRALILYPCARAVLLFLTHPPVNFFLFASLVLLMVSKDTFLFVSSDPVHVPQPEKLQLCSPDGQNLINSLLQGSLQGPRASGMRPLIPKAFSSQRSDSDDNTL